MTDPKASLKKRFENGALPNGEDFSRLIDFFTPEKDFKAQVMAFEALKTAPDVTLGPKGNGWTMSLDETQSHIWLAPDAHKPKPKADPKDLPTHVEADVGLYGWVGMGGHVGTLEGRTALQGATSELAGRLPKGAIFKSDGSSQPLFNAPGRPCVLEIVAATNRAIAEKPPFLTRFKQFVGFAAPDNAVLHAIARNTAGHSPPTVTLSGAPRTWPRALGIVLLIYVLVVAILAHLDPQSAQVAEAEKVIAQLLNALGSALTGIEAKIAQLLTKLGINGSPEQMVRYVAIGLAVLAGAIFVNRARNRSKNAITLKWVRTGAKSSAGANQFQLEIKGPDLARQGGNSNLYVHVTKLWA